jgi:hypothetical protein
LFLRRDNAVETKRFGKHREYRYFPRCSHVWGLR